MTTARDLITGSLRLLNVVQANETASPEDMELSLTALNSMLDSWSNERLGIFTMSPMLVELTAGKAQYTLGTGGDWDTPRPVNVSMAYVAIGGHAGGFGDPYPASCFGQQIFSGQDAMMQIPPDTLTVVCDGVEFTSRPIDFSTASVGGLGVYAAYAVFAGIVQAAFDHPNFTVGTSGYSFFVQAKSVGPTSTLEVSGPMADNLQLTRELGATIADPGGPIPENDGMQVPIEILNDDQWASIPIKLMESAFPTKLYDNGDYPLRTLQFWPVPNRDTAVSLWLWEPLVNLESLDDELALPPGYERALRFNLAIELSAEFGKTVPNSVYETANKAKAVIKRLNSTSQIMRGDDAISNRGSYFNWMIGDTL